MKVSIIGAGDVGAQTANEIAGRQIADEVVLVDIVDGLPQGRALDIQQYCPTIDSETKVFGSNSYADTRGSDVVVIVAGSPRKPGMTRDDLLGINKKIVESVTKSVANYSPNAVLLVVTNPVDAMTYAAWKASGFESKRVLGMAGVLDTARLKTLIAEKAGCLFGDIEAMVIGAHGDDMVPMMSHAKIKNRSVTEFLTKNEIDEIIKKTQLASQKIIELTKRSTSFAPAGSIAKMVEAILNDSRDIMPCSAYLEGEYGYKDVYIGVPAVLGKDGVESVIEYELDENEKVMFERSVTHAKENIAKLGFGEMPEKVIDDTKDVEDEKKSTFVSDNMENAISKITADMQKLGNEPDQGSGNVENAKGEKSPISSG
ncbi:MAG: malate dehydrogenase [Candidatus Micrarchaeota archaeon]|nr:malate dehydrogenase [Candidatus Micrarchaeota archaeon]